MAPRGIHPSGGLSAPVTGSRSSEMSPNAFSACHAWIQFPTPGTVSVPARKSRRIASQPPRSVFLSFSQYRLYTGSHGFGRLAAASFRPSASARMRSSSVFARRHAVYRLCRRFALTPDTIAASSNASPRRPCGAAEMRSIARERTSTRSRSAESSIIAYPPAARASAHTVCNSIPVSFESRFRCCSRATP